MNQTGTFDDSMVVLINVLRVINLERPPQGGSVCDDFWYC